MNTKTWAERFEEYDRDNPQIYTAFEGLALRLIERGVRRYSADALFHVLRFQTDVSSDQQDGYKLNSAFTPYYARKFMEEHPEYQEFFETRRLLSLKGEVDGLDRDCPTAAGCLATGPA